MIDDDHTIREFRNSMSRRVVVGLFYDAVILISFIIIEIQINKEIHRLVSLTTTQSSSRGLLDEERKIVRLKDIV